MFITLNSVGLLARQIPTDRRNPAGFYINLQSTPFVTPVHELGHRLAKIDSLPYAQLMSSAGYLVMQKILQNLVITIFLATAFLAGCSSDSDAPMGELTLRLTDLPLDVNNIDSVCVAFNRITVHHVEQGEISIDYLPTPEQMSDETHCPMNGGTVRPVKLNALAGPVSVALAESFQVPSGRISWIRLHFVPGESVVIRKDAGFPYALNCNSCEPTDNNDGRGFKLVRSFDIPVNGNLALMVDIDLRRSLAFRPNAGEYNLNPTARIDIDDTLGGISGMVDESLIVEPGTIFDGSAVTDTGCAVYFYEAGTGPDDYFEDRVETSPVITTASVRYDIATGLYRYVTATLPGGTESDPILYNAALTCDLDDAEVDEELSFGPLIEDIAVVGGMMTLDVDFLAP